MRTDQAGNRVNARGVPTGAIETAPTAAYDEGGVFKDAAAKEKVLLETLAEAGVELGAYDRRMVAHYASMCDWPMLATIASWILRSHGREAP